MIRIEWVFLLLMTRVQWVIDIVMFLFFVVVVFVEPLWGEKPNLMVSP